MVTGINNITSLSTEQRFILPGQYNWTEFKSIQAILKTNTGLKITYLDGAVELMTTGEIREIIKKFLAILLEAYLIEQKIPFIPVGNATREAEEKGASFAPDESYYLGQKKEHPDLAIEVVLTSGGIEKLEKYKRFKILEVWFWKNEQISVYCLRDSQDKTEIKYEKVAQSELLPKLNLDRLIQCAKMEDLLEARAEFLKIV